ncbi:MAG: hypothetical protein ACLPYS_00340 [Vulcanimicrobiaceae bacterium]
MSINESLEKTLQQARELEQSISDAIDKALDQLKPQVESSLHIARDLQVTFTKHMEAEAELVIKNSTDALSHLDDYMALGAQALSDSSEQARSIAKKMVAQSMKVVEAAAAAASSVAGKPAEPAVAGTAKATPEGAKKKSEEPTVKVE